MKYHKKLPSEDVGNYLVKICIGCGTERTLRWAKSLPVPNKIGTTRKPSWFDCKLGNNEFLNKHEVELDVK